MICQEWVVSVTLMTERHIEVVADTSKSCHIGIGSTAWKGFVGCTCLVIIQNGKRLIFVRNGKSWSLLGP